MLQLSVSRHTADESDVLVKWRFGLMVSRLRMEPEAG